MNKDFSQKKLCEMTSNKQMKILFDLAVFIEVNHYGIESSHFLKLKKYHAFLQDSEVEFIKILNKEFAKIKALDYQFQIYLMNLERLMGQSSKEYQFLINKTDSVKTHTKAFPIKVVLDSVRSAHNIGAITRNCECFNIEELVLTGLSPSLDHPQVIKTAMGCEKLVPWSYHQDCVEYLNRLKQEGFKIWAIETIKEAEHIHHIDYIPPKLAIVFGHEQFGLSHKVVKACDKFIDIKLFGAKNSLNVATSNAVILNHLTNLPSE